MMTIQGQSSLDRVHNSVQNKKHDYYSLISPNDQPCHKATNRLTIKATNDIPADTLLGKGNLPMHLIRDVTDKKDETGSIIVRLKQNCPEVEVIFSEGVSSKRAEEILFNWPACITAARDRHEQNVEAIYCNYDTDDRLSVSDDMIIDKKSNQIEFRTLRHISAGDPLLAWFSDELALLCHIPTLMPYNIRGGDCYMCTQCKKVFKHPNPLKSHLRFHCKLKNIKKENYVYDGNHRTQLNNIDIDRYRNKLESSNQIYHKYNSTPSAFTAAQPIRLDDTEKCNERLNVKCENVKSPVNSSSIKSSNPITVTPSGVAPIQIFNHIHTPPAQLPIDYMALNYYYNSLQHQARLGLSFMSPLMHPPNMRIPHPAFLNPATTNYHKDFWTQARTQRHSTPTISTSPTTRCSTPNTPISPVICESPVASKSEDHHHTSPHVTPASMFNIPLLSAKEGEPLDLLPRSLYMNKSQKGHICVYCGKLYSRKYGLKIHLRTHTGYKPLKCKICLRPFGDPSNLNKHIRLHAEGETPYRCEHCGKVLVRRRDLERHIASRHPDKLKTVKDSTGERENFYQKNETETEDVDPFSEEDLDESISEIEVT